MSVMIRYFLLLVLLLFGFDAQKSDQSVAVQEDSVVVQQSDKDVKKQSYPEKEEPAICENLTVAECLTIIIPAIWDREVEKDCS
ncbi:MAG: hypothetical protein Sup05_0821 [uncultured Candidatus Thioglobus sp.]|jgi:predicted negative regulator of RcsB-dependent stress response|nr:MAG: hypothetical protein Sup05_0821 [uncultured Candidatus Thioglobus sp.]